MNIFRCFTVEKQYRFNSIAISLLDQLSKNKNISMIDNSVNIPLQNDPTEKTEPIIKVNRNKTSIRKWIFLALIVDLIAIIGILIHIIVTIPQYPIASGKHKKVLYLHFFLCLQLFL